MYRSLLLTSCALLSALVTGCGSLADNPDQHEPLAVLQGELANPDGTIVFTDMPGGTPNNLSFPLIKDMPRVEMVSGVNLCMLVSAFSYRARMPLESLVEKIVADGQKAIRDVRRMFLAAAGRC